MGHPLGSATGPPGHTVSQWLVLVVTVCVVCAPQAFTEVAR